ncbi:MAG: hypothetical protein KDA24_25905 [Deltaproteobacteria bacterium]|nr:hypothetical protein [Deltaproteobacteria bacterium]
MNLPSCRRLWGVVALALALLVTSSAHAEGVEKSLLEALLRLPTSEARRARLVQELSDPTNDDLETEQLGSALAVLGTLDAADRDDPYIVRLFLIAAFSEDPEMRDEGISAARRGRGPPAPADGSAQEEASRFLLEREWLTVRGDGRRLHVVDYKGVRLPLSRFVYRARDEEIRAVLETESRDSWRLFGGLFGGGFAAVVGGGVSLVAGSDTGFDGVGGGRAPNPEAARAVGGVLVGLGTAAIISGAVQRSAVATNHRLRYRRYYTPERLEKLVRRRNEKAAANLGVSPDADDGP